MNEKKLFIQISQGGKFVLKQKFDGFIHYNNPKALEMGNEILSRNDVTRVQSLRGFINLVVVPHKRNTYISALNQNSRKIIEIKLYYHD